MNKQEAKILITKILEEASKLIPKNIDSDLKAINEYPDVPEWHPYEDKIWTLGEDIRQILIEHKSLRKDKKLLNLFLEICMNRNAKRGRQSFIMLFCFKHCAEYAPMIITQVDDKFVEGHVILAINKMHATGYRNLIAKFCESKNTWIRNEAKKYMASHK